MRKEYKTIKGREARKKNLSKNNPQISVYILYFPVKI